MTEEEYKLVTRRMRSLWPSLGAWMASLDEDAQNGIRERWRLCLLPLDRSACEDAVQSLAASGDDPWPYPSDKERAAAIVAELARKAAWSKRMSDVRLKEDQQRFGCHVCRDTGMVSCYRSRDVYWISRLRRLPTFANTYTMRCSCRAAQKPHEPDGCDYDRNRDVAYHQSEANVISDAVAIYKRIEEDATRVDSDGRVAAFDAFNLA